MRVQVVLPGGCIRLEPGGHCTRRVLVRNLGLTDERFTFEVIGPAASWTTLDPPVLRLGPDATAQVAVHFHPPRASHVRAGSTPFAVLTNSTREAGSSVVEQLLEVGRFTDTAVDLIPQSIRRASATYQLAVQNRGNDTVRVSLRGRDPAAALRVQCTPASLIVFPGTSARSGVRVRPICRHWRGSPLVRPFEIIVDPGDADIPLTVPGELVQHPILPP